MERKAIKFGAKPVEELAFMAEGNPGAISVFMSVVAKYGESRAIGVASHLEDMNMRGSQVCIAFKDFANQDLQTFVEAVESRDEALVACVNAENDQSDSEAFQAVRQGAAASRELN